ncbi:MAG: TatD family hydrolase [Gammaproteobacteria bacterium]|nr:TatD family hydrolase [Gammaproteobacteria bacterium]
MKLIDSHCHLDDDRFDERRQQVIAQAAAANVTRMVIPATTANRWEKVKQVCEGHDGLYPAYGLHPMFIEQHQVNHLRELDEWLEREQPIAVGECGIDFFDSRVDEKWQLQLFREQLQLANNHHLPLIVHVRKAMDEVISLLRKQAQFGGVVHSFSGSQQQAQQLHDIGFKLGIAATLSFERAQKLRKVVAAMPDDALLIESDAPDQPGANHRGQLNEPGFIVEHLQTMAELRNTTTEDLAATLNQNAETLFNI